jgi:hypothetical protein
MPSLLVAVVLLAASLQEARRVDEAVRKGVAYLKTAASPGEEGIPNSDELLLLTLIHGGVPASDPRLSQLLASVLEAPLARTYKVALQAMALEELDRVKYQTRIFQCAQFLVDNQLRDGMWSYGKPTALPDPPAGTPTPGTARKPLKSGEAVDFGAPATGEKPRVERRIPVRRQREADEGGGDHSNSQYAALGLRACHDAGIVLPRETLEKAAEAWRRSQVGAGEGEDDDDTPKKGRRVATPGGAEARGWAYNGSQSKATGSMTAGAVGALAIYDSILEKDWKKDAPVVSGLNWLARNFTVRENPGHGREWHYYYLYALERAGMLTGVEKIGSHDWYAEGAKYLLDHQRADGSWPGGEEEEAVWNTCFAILFLKRSTRPLIDVPSVDRYAPSRPR